MNYTSLVASGAEYTRYPIHAMHTTGIEIIRSIILEKVKNLSTKIHIRHNKTNVRQRIFPISSIFINLALDFLPAGLIFPESKFDYEL